MTDFYRDTDERMLRDPAFNAVVKFLMNAAREHGFTPGELKQMAFRAALELEMRRTVTRVPGISGGNAGSEAF